MAEAATLGRTPLNQWHHDHGGKMVDFAGWEMPVQYGGGIIKEHLATRRYGGLFDVSHMGRFRIGGKDRIAFLQHVLSNNCQALEPWQSQYTIIQTQTGGSLDDAFLYRFGEDDYILVVNASNRERDWEHLIEQASRFKDVTLKDNTFDLALIAFQGPLSKAVLERLSQGGIFPEPKQNSLSEIVLCGSKVLISRTGYTGEPNSFELFTPSGKALEVWEALLSEGSPLGMEAVGLGARDTLRLEASMPLYGHELGLDPKGREIPIFALGLAPVAVSLSPLKCDFIGREALCAQFEALKLIREGATQPPPDLARRIMPLALLDKGIARPGHEVYQGEHRVGVVTSGTSCPYWKLEGEGAIMHLSGESATRSLVLAYVDSTLRPETELEIVVRKRRLKAQVVKFHGRSEAPPYFHALPVGWSRPHITPPVGKGLSKARELVQKSLTNHRWRQEQCINLIPSEQTPSPLVRLLSVSDPVCRYAEHKQLDAVFAQEVFYYQGTDFIAWVEEKLAAELAAYLGCGLVEVRPISGQMANMTLFSALVSWKNRTNLKVEPQRISLALTHHIGRGGHLSAQPMGALRDYIAKDCLTERFAVINFPVLADNPFQVDLVETEKLLAENDPELIVFGRSMTLHKEPITAVRGMLEGKNNRPMLMYDMAHVLGLLGPHFQQPFAEGADLVTGSTHKTFFGTQRGIVAADFAENTPEYELWEAINRRAFPGMVSNHHLGSLLGLLLGATEMNAFKDQYQPQVIANAKALAKSLAGLGVKVCGDPAIDYTETHQVVLDVGYAQGPEVARRLEDNNIIVNYQALPTDEGFTASSGLRLGTAEMTRFGMKENDMESMAGLMAEVIKHKRPVKEEAAKLRGQFTRLGYCFQHQDLEDLTRELLETF